MRYCIAAVVKKTYTPVNDLYYQKSTLSIMLNTDLKKAEL